MSFWAAATTMVRKDLLVEGRSGEVMWITIPFGIVALFLIPLALPLDSVLLRRIGLSMFWVVLLLFGMTIALRQSASASVPQRDALRLLGIDPAARFTGRCMASALLLIVFELLLAPAVLVLFDVSPPQGFAWLLAPGMLAAIGLAIIGTLASELTRGLRTRTALAPLLVAPLSAPLLVPAAQATESVVRGDGILLPASIMMFAVLGLAVVGVVTAGPLEEASR